MGETKKKCIKIIAFCLIALMIFTLVFRILWISYSSGSYREFYKEKDNTANVVLIGTSTIRRDWISLEAWRETGYNYFAMCSVAQPLPLIKYLMIESEKTQSPDLYVIDLRSMSLPGGSYVKSGDIRRVTDNMKISANRKAAIDDSLKFAGIKTSNGNRDYYFSFMYYHSMWKNISLSNITRSSVYKGYCLDSVQTTSTATTASAMGWDHNATPTMPAINKKYFDELLSYINSHKLKVLFLIPPMQFSEEDSGRLAATVDYLKAKGYNIYDANDHYAEMNIDFSKDFRNVHHMSQWGAQKFTKVFAKYITAHYNLTKHVNASETAQWNKAYADYESALKSRLK